jgi:hypothetical protein
VQENFTFSCFFVCKHCSKNQLTDNQIKVALKVTSFQVGLQIFKVTVTRHVNTIIAIRNEPAVCSIAIVQANTPGNAMDG